MVRLEQATEEFLALDPADGAVGGRWVGFASVDVRRDSIADPLVWPMGVVDAPKCPQNAAQAPDANGDGMVQALLIHRSA